MSYILWLSKHLPGERENAILAWSLQGSNKKYRQSIRLIHKYTFDWAHFFSKFTHLPQYYHDEMRLGFVFFSGVRFTANQTVTNDYFFSMDEKSVMHTAQVMNSYEFFRSAIYYTCRMRTKILKTQFFRHTCIVLVYMYTLTDKNKSGQWLTKMSNTNRIPYSEPFWSTGLKWVKCSVRSWIINAIRTLNAIFN